MTLGFHLMSYVYSQVNHCSAGCLMNLFNNAFENLMVVCYRLLDWKFHINGYHIYYFVSKDTCYYEVGNRDHSFIKVLYFQYFMFNYMSFNFHCTTS